MTWQNYDSAMAQMAGAGLVIDKPLDLDGRIQRWKTDDDPREKRGWSRLREWRSRAGSLYIVGVYGVWRGNDDGKTKIEFEQSGGHALDADDLAAIRAANKEAARKLAEERKHEAKRAGAWAAQVWSRCAPCAQHEYLTRKRIQAHGLRVFESADGLAIDGVDDGNWWRLTQAVGALVVPMHDAVGTVCGLQFVYGKDHPRRAKLDKEFWPSGMAMGGTFGLLGPVRRAGVLLVAEGYATAASLHEATGQSVAYAFSANNLLNAGRALRKQYPSLRMLFCADDDYLTDGNPGCAAAAQATAAIEKSAWTKPDFMGADGVDLRGGKKLTDYNDLAVLSGVPLTLANQINGKLDELRWRDATSAQAEPQTKGGGDEGGRRAAVSYMPLDDLVERFVFVDDETGDFAFDFWTKQVVRLSKVVKLLPPKARFDDVKDHPRWKSRAVYIDQIGFDPGGDDPNIVCNRWNGWPSTPKQGVCERQLELLRYLCGNESNSAQIYDWLLCWLAYPLQHPGAKLKSAIVVHGPQGTGKSLAFEAYAKIYGEYAMILNQGAIEDKFNADWCERKLFILADEIVARAEMHHLKNQLKNFITGDWVRVNPKNVAAHRERNHMNIVFSSNEDQPVVLENDDRRHLVLWTPPKLDAWFYQEVAVEIDSGGVDALHRHLLDLDLGEFKPWTTPPMTDAKRDLIAIGSDSLERFFSDWHNGDVDGVPFCPAPSSSIYAVYLRWCRDNGEKFPRTSAQFVGRIRKRPGWHYGHKDRYLDLNSSAKKRVRFVVPSDAALNDAARRGGNDYRKRPESSETEWLTECYFEFERATEGHP